MNFKILIDVERCKGCAYCVNACTKAVLKMSRRMNSKGYHVPTVDKPDACIGCRNCTSMCPDTAIRISSVLYHEGSVDKKESRNVKKHHAV